MDVFVRRRPRTDWASHRLRLVGHAMRWERMLPYRGFPPFALALPARRGRAWSVPPSLLPVRGLRVQLGREVTVLFLVPVCRRGPKLVYSGDPPRAPAAGRWHTLLGGGFPSPFPPSTAVRVRRGLPFGGVPLCCSSSVRDLRSKSSLGAPLWFKESPSWGFLPLGLSGVPPPSPSMHAMGVCFWVGVPPLPSPPLRPLVLGMRNRLGGGSPPSPRLPGLSPRARSWGCFVPPLLPLCVPCRPMAVFGRSRPRADCASHRRCPSRAG